MRHYYATRGVCSKSIEFEIEGGVLHNIRFEGGCPGNLQGVARLAEGRTVAEIVALLSGVTCGEKKTSCPDQLARALKRRLPKKAAGKGPRGPAPNNEPEPVAHEYENAD